MLRNRLKNFKIQYNPPHFHAEYQGEQAEYNINTLEVIVGKISKRANALVLEWASIHREELMEFWEKAKVPTSIGKILPLK